MKEVTNEPVDEPVEEPKVEYELDMDNMPPVKHIWVDRGEVLSCENAGHLNHRHFKFKR